MHGRIKVRTTAEQEALKKAERAKKLAKYRAGIALIFQKRKECIYDKELLLVTEQMLLQNPDIYTIWNIRREAFQNNDWSGSEYEEALQKELILTENCLRENPKSYNIWHQRCWAINNIQNPNWERELSLCAKCLDLDERNFHCWDYRQFIVEKAKVPDTEEFDFSTSKILRNFSNYSSWHYRSKILSKMFHTESKDLPITEEKHKDELELVMNATFTDPNDSSAWFYQRWLLDNCKHPSCTLWRVCITQDEGIVVFDNDMEIASADLNLYINDTKINTVWKSLSHKKFDKVWVTCFEEPLQDLSIAKEVFLTFKDNTFGLHYSNIDSMWLYKDNSMLRKEVHNEEQLRDQLESYKQLAKMEPNNKWTLLTGILLMKKIDFVQFHETIMNDLLALSNVDTLRYNYYKDLRSKYHLDYKFYRMWHVENNLVIQKKIDLSGLGLTTISNNQYFIFFNEVNLGANFLSNSLFLLSTLQKCQKLSLSSNELKSLKSFPTLVNLKILSLRNNKLNDLKEILDLLNRHNLQKLDLRENPICKIDNVAFQISNIFPKLQVDLE